MQVSCNFRAALEGFWTAFAATKHLSPSDATVFILAVPAGFALTWECKIRGPVRERET
jgi:hypothetical protein